MRFMTDRKEIAKAINIDKKPVIRIDISNPMKGWDDCYEGDKVVVIAKSGYDIRCTAKMFGDSVGNEKSHAPHLYKTIKLMPEANCITSHFGYSDVIEMVEWRKAIRVHEGEQVIIIFDQGDTCFIREMTVGKVSEFVYPTATIRDAE